MTRSVEERLGNQPVAITSGVTLRELIAMHALQGILASPSGYNDATYQGAARDAVAHADALLAALAMPLPAGRYAGDDDE